MGHSGASLRLIHTSSAKNSPTSSKICSPAPSPDLRLAIHRCANKFQLVLLNDPNRAMYLLGIAEKFLDIALKYLRS